MNRARLLLYAFAAVCAVHLLTQLVHLPLLEHATKPLLMPLLAAWAVISSGNRAPRLLVGALLCGWAGDTLLMIGGAAFLAGMGAFAAGHLCWITLLVRRGALLDRRRILTAGAAYAVYWVTAVVLLWPGLDALRIPVAVYSLLLTTTAATSAGLGLRTGIGGGLFLLSDTLIATDLADWPQLPVAGFWVMATYLAAQYLLTTGTLRTGAAAPAEAQLPQAAPSPG